jgi:hypothetical protein
VDTFVVDFKVRAAQEVFTRGCAADVCEDVFHRAGNNTRLVLVSGLRDVVNIN